MKYFKTERPRIEQILEEGKHFLLLSHLDPDGDALGAMFGLAGILKKMKKIPVIGLNNGVPRRYDFMASDTGYKITSAEKVSLNRIDGIFILDASSINRLDHFAAVVSAAREAPLNISVINIDHHPDNQRFGDINIVDTQASSASQLVVELFGARALDLRSAIPLYTGIVGDTGSFRHGTDMKRCHQAAVLCLNHKIDTKKVNDNLFAIETEGSLRLFSRALSRLTVLDKGRLASMHLTHADYKDLKLTAEDSAGFISRMLIIEGARVLVFFNETEKNVVKISFRSNAELDVGEIAAKFGGGGHARASGCVIEGVLERVIDRVLKTIKLVQDAAKGD